MSAHHNIFSYGIGYYGNPGSSPCAVDSFGGSCAKLPSGVQYTPSPAITFTPFSKSTQLAMFSRNNKLVASSIPTANPKLIKLPRDMVGVL